MLRFGKDEMRSMTRMISFWVAQLLALQNHDIVAAPVVPFVQSSTTRDASHNLIVNPRLRRTQQLLLDQSAESTCTHSITTVTAPLSGESSVISSFGILFTVSSPYHPRINKETIITSLGFYVDTAELQSNNGNVKYQVFTLLGYYADPERTGSGGLPVNTTFDYRGKFDSWDKIAEGPITVDDLETKTATYSYFQVPNIQSTSIASGAVQSYYITLAGSKALLYTPLENYEEIHEEQSVLFCENTIDCINGGGIYDKPIIQIGEGVVSYPFPTVPYFYQPRKFIGSIYYLGECLTASPSATPTITSIPTATQPTSEPTVTKSILPSHSHVPTDQPTRSAQPSTLSYIYDAETGCHTFISTDQEYVEEENKASYGIVFPIQSNKKDDDGVRITSFGFHIDFAALPPLLDRSEMNAANYEVYVLSEHDIYADPNRTAFEDNKPETFDYRGDFSLWEMIAKGSIRKDDLSSDTEDYFEIPFGQFKPVLIPPYGGIRSFYLTLDTGSFVYKEKNSKQLGALQRDDDFKNPRDKTQDPPLLLYGEVVKGFPFYTTPFLYSTSEFVGRVFYEYQCPSPAPSLAPSFAPSETPSQSPSTKPSYQPSIEPSSLPSDNPSVLPSAYPSFGPTESPSILPSTEPSVSPSPTYQHFPSISPSKSSSPSDKPSLHPTISQDPSISSRPTSEPFSSPSSQPSSSVCKYPAFVVGLATIVLSLFLEDCLAVTT